MDKALEALAEKVGSDPAFAQEMASDPAAALQSNTAQTTVSGAFTTDVKFYRMAVGGLIGLILLVIVFAFVLEVGWNSKTLPDWIAALATTALGAVVGVFAPSPAGSRTGG
jgi:hypothetical protein